VGLGASAPGLPHALAQIGVCKERGKAFVPLDGRACEVTAHPVANHLGIDSHRTCDDGDSARHILNGFERALPSGKGIVAQGHDADIELHEVVHLLRDAAVVLPRSTANLDPRAVEAPRAEEQEAHGNALGKLFQDRSQGL